MPGRVARAAMGREEQVNMDTDKRTKVLHDLELKHQKNASDSDLLDKDEEVRRLRLRILLLKDENTLLRDEISRNNEINKKLANQCDDLGTQIEAKMEVVRMQEKQLSKQEREYSNLKAELQSMSSATQDSTNLLSEKLTLGRELAVLKPEIEHLRSQVNQQQATLAEKLALERQVTTLEVELANEKKAIRRAMQKRESNDRVEDELRKQLRETEKKLTAEKAERERLEDQLEQEKITHKFALEEQDSTRELEADLRKKLQEVQRQLRDEKEIRERLDEELQAVQRTSKKQRKRQTDNDAEDALRAQLEDVQRKLETEQEGSTKLRQEGAANLAEAEARNAQFEKMLEKLRTRLQETQDQLKRCKADLQKARDQQQQSRPLPPAETTKVSTKPAAFRKRKAQDITGDFTQIEIQTPGAADTGKGGRRTFKKQAFEPTLVGEKSMFSITPFLNRTKNLSDDNSKTDNDDTPEDSILGGHAATESLEITTTLPIAAADPTRAVDVESAAPSTTEHEKPKAQPKPRGRPKKVLGEAPSAKKNAQTAAPVVAKKALKTKSSLEKVAEEEGAAEAGKENRHRSKDRGVLAATTNNDKAKEAPPAERTTTVKFNFSLPPDDDPSSTAAATGEETQQPKKKKRKVLGSAKTLFDDDNEGAGGEAALPPLVIRKPGAKAVPLGSGGSGKSGAGAGTKRSIVKKGPLAAAQRSAFAGSKTFSPLKRDRRGVGASFLA